MKLVPCASVVALATAAALAVGCPGDNPGEGEGEGELPPCFIGDAVAPAELSLIKRAVDGSVEPLEEGGEVPLVLAPQGGHIALVGVRALNITCRAQFTAGMRDTCATPPRVFALESRPVVMVPGPDGSAIPEFADTLQNWANVPVCPTFGSTSDADGRVIPLELRIIEELREGEAEQREHVLNVNVIPRCGEPANLEDCTCECDADFTLDLRRDEQCPTINDNDPPPDQCSP